MALSDRILVMNLGVVQQVDTPLNVHQKPANRLVFGYIGLSNFLEVNLQGGVRGVVKRCAYLGEIIDYRVDVGDQEIRLRKGRRTSGPREGEPCGLVFLKPHWYGAEE